MQKTQLRAIGIIAAVAALAVGGWFVFVYEKTTVFAQDTVIEGDFAVAASETIVLRDGARLHVKGSVRVAGQMDCQNGGLYLEVDGDFASQGALKCGVREDAAAGEGIAIVARGNVLFSADSSIQTNGSIQIVGSPDELIASEEDMEDVFQEIASEECEGVCAGPFVPGGGGEAAGIRRSGAGESQDRGSVARKERILPFVSVAFAVSPTVVIMDPDTVRISGDWIVDPPRRNRRSVVLLRLPYPNLQLADLNMELPDGRPGESDEGSACNRYGAEGGFAGRLGIWAVKSILVNNVTISLGDGGEGGSATTADDCYPEAVARGGDGGRSGNLKMMAGEAFDIEGTFRINPGTGGNGGEAKATAGDAPKPGMRGGDAVADGGAGADSDKRLSVRGDVSGISNIEIAPIVGGNGGLATALAGNGGDGLACEDGGRGGHAAATGGNGGDSGANLSGLPVGGPAGDKGGDGGDAQAVAGLGADGGDCDCGTPASRGGKGGEGGNAKATPGSGGTGGPTRNDGNVLYESGGSGGYGGSITDVGTGSGIGGEGGAGGDGNPPGIGGVSGESNTCTPPTEIPPKKETIPADTSPPAADDTLPPAETGEKTQDTSPASEDPSSQTDQSGAEQGDEPAFGDVPMYVCPLENNWGTCYIGGPASEEDLEAGCPDLPKCPPLDD